MKKKFFNNTSCLLMSTLALTFTIISCKKTVAPSVNDDGISAQSISAKSSNSASNGTVALRVTVSNAAGNRITSDNNTEYVNGSQNVQAVIDRNGNFVFNTNTRSNSSTAIRSLNFNFSEAITIYNTPPAISASNNYTIETVPSSVIPGFIPLQNIPVLGSECVSLRCLGTNWRLLFHAGYDDRTDSTTAFAVVTRTSSTQWTIAPLAGCTPASVANKAAFRSGTAAILYGYYNMPFLITINKL